MQPHRRQRSADASTPIGGATHPAKAAGDAEHAARAEEHVAAGYALRKGGDFAAAAAEYGAALGFAPRHFKALFNRGFCLDKVTAVALRHVGKECCGLHGLCAQRLRALTGS